MGDRFVAKKPTTNETSSQTFEVLTMDGEMRPVAPPKKIIVSASEGGSVSSLIADHGEPGLMASVGELKGDIKAVCIWWIGRGRISRAHAESQILANPLPAQGHKP